MTGTLLLDVLSSHDWYITTGRPEFTRLVHYYWASSVYMTDTLLLNVLSSHDWYINSVRPEFI